MNRLPPSSFSPPRRVWTRRSLVRSPSAFKAAATLAGLRRDPHDWLRLVEQTVENADMIGSVYTIRLQGRQETWIMDQPWYTGLPVRRSQRVAFCTGGWWAIRTEVLQKFQWPPPELVHRGGDVMLSELCRQQQLRISDFSEGVAINANAEGVAARAPRRGFDSHPIGFA